MATPLLKSIEVWKWVPGFPGYQVSDFGHVRSWLRPGKATRQREEPVLRKPTLNTLRDNYYAVILRRDGRSHCMFVHRLVLEAFDRPREAGEHCRHLDGNSQNNRLDNLKWGTPTENHFDSRRHGTDTVGERNAMAKLSQKQANKIRKRLTAGERGMDVAADLGVSQATISRIKHGVRYG